MHFSCFSSSLCCFVIILDILSSVFNEFHQTVLYCPCPCPFFSKSKFCILSHWEKWKFLDMKFLDVLHLCMQMHIYVPLSMFPFSQLEWRGNPSVPDWTTCLLLIQFPSGVLFCVFKNHCFICCCLPFCWYLSLHSLNLLIFFIQKSEQFHMYLTSLCFP